MDLGVKRFLQTKLLQISNLLHKFRQLLQKLVGQNYVTWGGDPVFFSFLLPSSLELSDTKVYEP